MGTQLYSKEIERKAFVAEIFTPRAGMQGRISIASRAVVFRAFVLHLGEVKYDSPENRA